MTGKIKIFLAAVVFFLAGMLAMISQQRELARLQEQAAAIHQSNARLEARMVVVDRADAPGPVGTLAEMFKAGARSPLDIARDALRYVDSLKPGEMAGALDAVKKMLHTTATNTVRALLLARWADENPADASAWVKSNDNPDDRRNDFGTLFQAWSANDPGAAIAGLAQIGNSSLQADIENNLLGLISLTNPQGALDLFNQKPAGEQSVNGLSSIFRYWAAEDPAGASAAALNLPASAARLTALGSLSAMWAQQDPQAALAFVNSLPAGATRDSALGPVLNILSQSDPASAANLAAAMPLGADRNSSITQIAANWSQQDPAAALAWVGNIATGTTYDQAVQGVLAQMDTTDPTDAATFIAQMPNASTRDGAITQLASAWAQTDLPGALAWVQALPTSEGQTRIDALRNVMRTWDNTDPQAASVYIMQNFQSDPDFNYVAEQMVGHWVGPDPQAALTWAEALPPGQAQADSLATVFSNISVTDPQAAWASAQQLPDGSSRDKAMGTVVATWSAQDPAQAATLLGTLPAGLALDDATAEVAANWVQQNPAAASQWVNTLPLGSARDGAVVSIISAEGQNNLATSFAWAASINDVTTQQNQLNNVVNQWAKKDPAAAASAVQSAPLTNQQRTDLLKTIQTVSSSN